MPTSRQEPPETIQSDKKKQKTMLQMFEDKRLILQDIL